MTALWYWLWQLAPGNPILQRIVHSGSRRLRHLYIRLIYLGVLALLVLIGLLSSGGLGSEMSLIDLAKAGVLLFAIIAYGQIVLICLFAPLFMAGAIAEEQAGETYDILLTTPLTNLQIVLGSLGGRLFFVLALLLSGLPLFAILLFFGGVPMSSVFAAFTVAAITALSMGSVAIALSVFRIGGRKAVFIFVIVIMAYLAGAWALDAVVLRELTAQPDTTTWLTPLHPLLVLEASIERASYQPPQIEQLGHHPTLLRWYLGRPFAAFTTMGLAGSVLILLLCAAMVRRANHGESRWLEAVRRSLRLGAGDSEPARRVAREVSHDPIAWREANTRGNRTVGILTRWGFVLLGLALAGGLLALYHYDRLPTLTDAHGNALRADQVLRGLLIVLVLLELAIICLMALYMSASCVSREREDGTLDLILTTPVTARAYIWGKLRGLVRFLGLLIALPVASVAMASLYALLGLGLQWPQARFTSQTLHPQQGTWIRQEWMILYPEAPLLLLLLLVSFTALCVATGMSWSLRSRSVLGAVVPAVLIIGGTTLVLSLCGLAAVSQIPYLGPLINGFSPATNVLMILDPWDDAASPWGGVASFHEQPGITRIMIAVAAVVATIVYCTVVYGMVNSMIRGFDHTVRRLSGA